MTATPRLLHLLCATALATATAFSALPDAATAAVPAPVAATPRAAATSVARASTWTPRPAQYAKTVTRKDLKIPMSDGVVLRGDLTLPATAAGTPVPHVPVIVTITAYNKTVIAGGGGSTLAGADPAYLVARGYAQFTVDARGTGSSPGQWCAFCAREDKDAGEIVAWAHRQPWSNGKVGMTGASYMGISQLFAAEHHPAGLKAIFPQVPAADVYRDVVASGGGFTLPLALTALLGGDPAYDSSFYRQRSPISAIDKVDVPTFIVGGEYDLFQRGEPLDFSAIQHNGVPAKLIYGPWDHLQGSSGAQVGAAGYGSLAQLQLRWFDHWIKGMDTHLDQIAPVTYYEQGTKRWRRAGSWVGGESPATYRLSGTATLGADDGALTTGTPTAGSSTMLPLPVSGLCTRSSNQWTAGVPNVIIPSLPCFTDNQLNDKSGLVFQTAPLTSTLRIRGPINAHLNVATSTGDGLLAVTVEDVAPDGTVSRLTGGWQVVSQRALDTTRSQYLGGRLIRPYHPFTKASKATLAPGTVAPVDVEVFPTGAAILPGHRLRVAIEGFDVPHLLAPLTDLLGQLGPLTIYSGGAHPSYVTLPVN